MISGLRANTSHTSSRQCSSDWIVCLVPYNVINTAWFKPNRSLEQSGFRDESFGVTIPYWLRTSHCGGDIDQAGGRRHMVSPYIAPFNPIGWINVQSSIALQFSVTLR